MFKKTASSGMSPKIPMLVGLLLLLAGVVGGVYLVQNRQSPTDTQADVGTAPVQVEISNVTDVSFTVSWTTANPATGFVTYGDNNQQINSVARDKRDLLSSDYQRYSTHFVQIVGANPNTEYFFMVNSGTIAYSTPEKTPYIVKTASRGANTSLSVVAGKLQTSDGGAQEGGLVFISGPNLSRQSVLSDANGNWTISLTAALNPSLDGPAMIDTNDELSIRTISGGGNSTALILGQQINEIPPLTAGGTFDFRSLASKAGKSASKFNFIDDLAAQGTPDRQSINIWNPQENEALNTTKPLFIGTAPVNTQVTLVVIQRQTQLTGTTTSDERGNWRWTSQEELALGSQVVRASYTNDSGITFQADRRFSILGNSSTGPAIESSPGGQLAQVSPSPTPSRVVTPTIKSATPTVTVKPTNTVTPTKVPSTTLTPTTKPSPSVTGASEVSPTATPSKAPTVTVTPTIKVTLEVSITPTPTTAQELPVASTTLPTYIAGIVIIIFLGLAVLLLS